MAGKHKKKRRRNPRAPKAPGAYTGLPAATIRPALFDLLRTGEWRKSFAKAEKLLRAPDYDPADEVPCAKAAEMAIREPLAARKHKQVGILSERALRQHPELARRWPLGLQVAAQAVDDLPVRRAVITVPAYFTDAQRQATREAGELAGFTVERLLNEPTAAAFAYELGQDSPKQKTILVYDLGGGTCDVSILRMEGDLLEVLATHGNTQLGGDDIDQLVLKKARGAFKKKYPQAELSETGRLRLQIDCEKLKIELSNQASAALVNLALPRVDASAAATHAIENILFYVESAN